MIGRYKREEMSKIFEDENKYRNWEKGEIAVLEAKNQLGLVPKEVISHIKENAGFTVERIEEIDKEIEHDMNAFITTEQERFGPKYKKWFHENLTSYDIEDTATALMIREAISIIEKGLRELMDVLKEKARGYKWTLMLGRTHGQWAGITTFAHLLLNYQYDLATGLGYLEEAKKTMAYGKISGIIGTYTNLNPQIEKKACLNLGINSAKISTQIISRARYAFLMSALTINAGILEKIATDIRNLSRPEIGEVREPFKEKQMGSSAKGHKKNPVICERICGQAKIIRGNIIPALENITTWEHRDITQSSTERIIIPDSFELLDYMIDKMIWVIKGLEVFPIRMTKNIERTYGTIASQEVRTVLLNKGMDPKEAYRAIQELSFQAVGEEKQLEDLILSSEKTASYFEDEKGRKDLKNCFDWENHVSNIDEVYSRFGI